MSLSSHFKTDPLLERKGVGIDLPENDDGTTPQIILARAGRNNPDYQKVAERIMRPHRRAQQVNALAQAKSDELTMEIFCEAGILSWSNIPLSEVTGNPDDKGYAPYTKENAIKLMTELPDLYASLIELSTSRDTFIAAVKAEEAKNSAPSLPTSQSKDSLS